MTETQEWDLSVSTPIGQQYVRLVLRETPDGLDGEAQGKEETVQLSDLVRVGDRLTWAQSITRPMRLNLRFEVTVQGDEMTGTAKAGRFPGSKVTGTRVA